PPPAWASAQREVARCTRGGRSRPARPSCDARRGGSAPRLRARARSPCADQPLYLGDGTEQLVLAQAAPQRVIDGARLRRALAIGGAERREDAIERHRRIETEPACQPPAQ